MSWEFSPKTRAFECPLLRGIELLAAKKGFKFRIRKTPPARGVFVWLRRPQPIDAPSIQLPFALRASAAVVFPPTFVAAGPASVVAVAALIVFSAEAASLVAVSVVAVSAPTVVSAEAVFVQTVFAAPVSSVAG